MLEVIFKTVLLFDDSIGRIIVIEKKIQRQVNYGGTQGTPIIYFYIKDKMWTCIYIIQY